MAGHRRRRLENKIKARPLEERKCLWRCDENIVENGAGGVPVFILCHFGGEKHRPERHIKMLMSARSRIVATWLHRGNNNKQKEILYT